MKIHPLSIILIAFMLLVSCAKSNQQTIIIISKDASSIEILAAKEVRRYVYQRSGQLLSIVSSDSLVKGADMVLIANKDRPIISRLSDENIKQSISKLKDQEYILKTIDHDNNKVVLLSGGDKIGTLYAAYRFSEHLGIHFYLHGDVIPDERVSFEIMELNEIRKPLFPIRGIQPFHDFPEGPDWWSSDDYKAILSQLPKMGMNFIGLHTYPESTVGPEPTVWIGLEKNIKKNGDVSFSYPSRYFTTLNDSWGYGAKKTSEYSFGADQLFLQNIYGAEHMKGMAPWPLNEKDQNILFNRTGNFFQNVFTYANKLGVQTCVGTQTPLTIPQKLRNRLIRAGKDPNDIKTTQSLYEGMFQWVTKNYPIDYYWLWTPENWTWGGNTEDEIQHTRDDLNAAIAALNKINPPFSLATSGWVLGPKKDRTMFDNFLSKDIPMSSINRQMGFTPVDVNFARLQGRPKWAIPWLEDDAALIIPQLWAGRMRQDAADALKYGCTGLIGIHWRTKIIAPNISALANAGWDQNIWNPNVDKTFEVPDINRIEGSPGALFAVFKDTTLGNLNDEKIFRTHIYSMNNYFLGLENGIYDVTLKFLEVHYKEKDKRFFGVKIQNKIVEKRLDIFAHVGYGSPLNKTYNDIKVSDGRLHLQFKKISDNAILAGIVITKSGTNEKKQIVRKINCASRKVGDYETDPSLKLQGFDIPRDLSVEDFYADWAKAQFGKEVAKQMADLFVSLDGNSKVKTIGQREANLPRPSDWLGGPGGIFPDSRSWDDVQIDYNFIDKMENMQTDVRGTGNLDRFEYWLNQFRYLRAIGKFRCTMYSYNKAMEKVRNEIDPDLQKKLIKENVFPFRKQEIEDLGEIHKHLLNSVSTTGGLGTVTNWQQHSIPKLIEETGRELVKILGEELPSAMNPSKSYSGNERMIITTIRSSIDADEPFQLKIIFLGKKPKSAAFYWRSMGNGNYKKIDLKHITRNSYGIVLSPDLIQGDFEYYIKAVSDKNKNLFFPATAPVLNQTVIKIL